MIEEQPKAVLLLHPRDRLAGWIIFFTAFAIYLITGSRIHTYDGLQYAFSVELGTLTELLHPHHLLYNVFSFVVWKVLGFFVTDLRALDAMNAISALFGALTLRIIWQFWRRTIVARSLALAGIVFLALSYGFWSYSAETEVYLPACFFIALALDRSVLTEGRPARPWAGQAGWAFAFAVLSTQSIVILFPGFLLWIMRQREERWSRTLRFILISSLPVFVAYVVGALLVAGFNFSAIYNWFTFYSQIGQWGHPTIQSPLIALSAILTSFLAVAPYSTEPSVIQAVVAPVWIPLIFVGFSAVLVLASVWGWCRQLRGWLGSTLPLFVVILLHLAFFIWWQPENVEFWILLDILLVTALLWGITRLAAPWRKVMFGVLLVTAIGVGTANYILFIGPRTIESRDEMHNAIKKIMMITSAEDYFLLPQDEFEKTLRYFGRYKNVLNSAELSLGEQGNDWGVALARFKDLQRKAERAGVQIYTVRNMISEGSLGEAVKAGDQMAMDLATYWNNHAYPLMEIPTPNGMYIFARVTSREMGFISFDATKLDWPSGSASPQSDGVAFFSNFTAELPFEIENEGEYSIKVRARGNAYDGVGAVLQMRVDNRIWGALEYSEKDWTDKDLPGIMLTTGKHTLQLSYQNDICDPVTNEGRDIFLSLITIQPALIE